MKLSDWNQRPFLNPLTAENLGNITGVYVTPAGRVRYLYANGNAYALSRLFADADALMMSAPPETPERCALVHLGAKAYDTTGKYLGEIADYDTESETHLTTLDLPLCRFVSGTEEILIVNPAKRILNRKKREPKNNKTTKSAPKVESAETPAETVVEQAASETAPVIQKTSAAPYSVALTPPAGQGGRQESPRQITFQPLPFAEHIRIEERETRASAPLNFEPPSPAREVDYSFLIGRRAERDVVDMTRTFLIPRGTLITAALVAQARRAGKIVDLASACSNRK